MRKQKRVISSWVWKFKVVLLRNARNYLRNPGNVFARTLVMLIVASLQVRTEEEEEEEEEEKECCCYHPSITLQQPLNH